MLTLVNEILQTGIVVIMPILRVGAGAGKLDPGSPFRPQWNLSVCTHFRVGSKPGRARGELVLSTEWRFSFKLDRVWEACDSEGSHDRTEGTAYLLADTCERRERRDRACPLMESLRTRRFQGVDGSGTLPVFDMCKCLYGWKTKAGNVSIQVTAE